MDAKNAQMIKAAMNAIPAKFLKRIRTIILSASTLPVLTACTEKRKPKSAQNVRQDIISNTHRFFFEPTKIFHK